MFYDGTNYATQSILIALTKIVAGVQHTDGPLQVKYWGGGVLTRDPCGVDAYAPVYAHATAFATAVIDCQQFVLRKVHST